MESNGVIYGLFLNCMHCNTEQRELVAIADTKEKLVQFMERERVEPYREGPWHKTFRSGSPLENFNPPVPLNADAEQDPFGHGITRIATRAEYIERAAREWDRTMEKVVRL